MNLRSSVIGTGHDLVLVHGWAMPASIWRPLAGELAQRFRVHAVDLPGYGGSAPCAPHTLDALASTLAREMPRACHVVGWSLGALIALEWARRAPQQIAKLALIGATPCFAQRPDWSHGVPPALLVSFARDLANDYEGTLKRFIALQVLGDRAAGMVAKMVRRSLAGVQPPSSEVLAAGLDILLDFDLRELLAAIGQDTLVIHGDRDRLTPVAAGQHLARGIPGARFELVEGAAHAPFLSQPALVTRLLDGFLNG